MLRAPPHWPLFAILAVFLVLSCGHTDSRERDAPKPGGTGGTSTATADQSGSEGPPAGRDGGAQDGGADGIGGTDVGGEGGLAQAGASGEAGSGGAPVDDGGGVAPTGLSILGDYVETNGDELWLRDSGKAVTLTRVPAGKPASSRLPSLWRVARACSAESFLVLEGAADVFTRLDYIAGPRSLTLCLDSETASSVEAATRLQAPNRANTIDAGCHAGPWVRVTKGTR